jgi:Sec-independent protein secretion pathway component TatC
MRIFVFFHVLSMFSAVAVAYGPAFLLHRAAATRHVPTIRAVFSMTKATGPLIPIFFLTGFGFALVAIFTEGFNPFRPWLLIAYVLFAIGMFTGFRIHAPYAQAVGRAAEASPDDAPSAELNQALDNPQETIAYWLDYAVIIGLIFDMIIKPFGF